jgi:uncharacterized peroxidase-related enzyme
MESHSADLRAEVGSQDLALAIQNDYRTAGVEAKEVALLDYAVKLTRSPSEMKEEDIFRLRQHGFTDEQIVDAVHCIAYFNFINRVLDGLGVDPDPFMRYTQEREKE